MRIAFISKSKDNYFDENVKLFRFESINQFNRYVDETTLRVDIVLVADSALGGEQDYAPNAKALKFALHNELLAYRYAIFLVRTANLKAKNYFEFIVNSLQEVGINSRVVVKDKFYPEDIEDVINATLPNQNVDAPEYINVIKKKRTSDIIAVQEIPELHTAVSSAIVVELNTRNTEKENNKKYFQNNTKPILKKSEDKEVDPIEFNTSVITPEEEPIIAKADIYAVTGISGVTTTALTLFKSAAILGKTLYIDMNYNSLGGSYILNSSKDVFGDELEIFKLDSLIENSSQFDELRTMALSDKKLQAITISTVIKDTIGAEVLECLILQTLKAIENCYTAIFIDLPYEHLTTYAYLMRKVNYLIHVTPGYKHKYVPAFMNLAKHECVKQFIMNKAIINFRVAQVEVNKGIKPTSRNIYDKYCQKYLGEVIPSTGITAFKDYERSDLYIQIRTLLKGDCNNVYVTTT